MTVVISKALRDEVLAEAAAKRPQVEATLTKMFSDHLTRAAERGTIKATPEQIGRAATRQVKRMLG